MKRRRANLCVCFCLSQHIEKSLSSRSSDASRWRFPQIAAKRRCFSFTNETKQWRRPRCVRAILTPAAKYEIYLVPWSLCHLFLWDWSSNLKLLCTLTYSAFCLSSLAPRRDLISSLTSNLYIWRYNRIKNGRPFYMLKRVCVVWQKAKGWRKFFSRACTFAE